MLGDLFIDEIPLINSAGMYFASVISIGTLGRQRENAASDVQKLTTHTTRITRENLGCSRGIAQDPPLCQQFQQNPFVSTA
jgi:hypothetical protein